MGTSQGRKVIPRTGMTGSVLSRGPAHLSQVPPATSWAPSTLVSARALPRLQTRVTGGLFLDHPTAQSVNTTAPATVSRCPDEENLPGGPSSSTSAGQKAPGDQRVISNQVKDPRSLDQGRQVDPPVEPPHGRPTAPRPSPVEQIDGQAAEVEGESRTPPESDLRSTLLSGIQDILKMYAALEKKTADPTSQLVPPSVEGDPLLRVTQS